MYYSLFCTFKYWESSDPIEMILVGKTYHHEQCESIPDVVGH